MLEDPSFFGVEAWAMAWQQIIGVNLLVLMVAL